MSSPLPTPSVIESPIATSALTGRGARTSTPVSTIHDPTGVANAAPPASREKSPEPDRYDVCSATGCSATTSGVLASTRLTAIGRPASATTGTGSLTSSAPGATTASERPAKATGVTVPGTRAAPEPARAADTGPTASGVVPNRFDSRTRTCEPVTCGRTIMRRVRPASGSVGGTACGLACQAATQAGPHRSTGPAGTVDRDVWPDPVSPTIARLPSATARSITPRPPPIGTPRRPPPIRHLRPCGTRLGNPDGRHPSRRPSAPCGTTSRITRT